MEKIKEIKINDENYPKILKTIPNPPKFLYFKGILRKEEPCLAIVGARNCTSHAKQAAFDIAKKASKSGLTIVSGLATGIDSYAHEAAIKRTIAVLGTGLDEKSIYPKENILLSRKIVESGGCLLSEYPPGDPGSKFTFPLRNRIISGLSLGVLVIESSKTGGSMITAKYAVAQKRKLFRLLKSTYSLNSEGINSFMETKAKPVSNIYDILKELTKS